MRGAERIKCDWRVMNKILVKMQFWKNRKKNLRRTIGGLS